MPEPIDGHYFNWLRKQVLDSNAPTYLYFDLLDLLYRTQYIAVILGDRNRLDDGLELRLDFLRETGLEDDCYWHDLPCSVLEVLIAFAKRASFVTDDPIPYWFWKFIENLRLDGYRTLSRSERRLVNRVIETWMYRIYDYSGDGGLFPMSEPIEDQRQLEIWYQFNQYLDDQGL